MQNDYINNARTIRNAHNIVYVPHNIRAQNDNYFRMFGVHNDNRNAAAAIGANALRDLRMNHPVLHDVQNVVAAVNDVALGYLQMAFPNLHGFHGIQKPGV